MKVQVKKLPHSEAELTISVPYDTYLKYQAQALKKLQQELKIPGFRPGHIPEDMVRQQIGPQGLHQATLEDLLPQTYAHAVKEQKLEVISAPKVEVKNSVQNAGDELVYIATMAVMPEVTVGNYKKIKVVRPKVTVEPKQVEETLQMILERFASWQEVKRTAQKGDRAEIDFEGFNPQGSLIPNTASKNHPLILGSNSMVPGFEEAIIGMGIGETKEFDLTFPKDYHSKTLQGTPVHFKLTLHRLEEKQEQSLDDAMVERITGQKQSADDFKKRVETDLHQEMNERAQGNHENQIVQEIIKITKVDLPQALIDDEIQHLLEEKKRQVERQGLTWEQYLSHIKKTDEDFNKEHQKPAEERLKARLGVQRIIRDAGITATDEETGRRLEQMLTHYPLNQQAKVRDYYKKDSEGYRTLKANVAADKLFEMLTKE